MKYIIAILFLVMVSGCSTHATVTLRCPRPDQHMTVNVNDTGEEVYISATCKTIKEAE